MLLLPFLRYVMGCCSNDSEHITNLESEDFNAEMQRAEDNATMFIGGVVTADNVHVYSFNEHFDYEKKLSDMVTVSGAPILHLDNPCT